MSSNDFNPMPDDGGAQESQPQGQTPYGPQDYAAQSYGAADGSGQGAPYGGRPYPQQGDVPPYGYGGANGSAPYAGGPAGYGAAGYPQYGQYQQPAYYAPVNKWNTMSIIGFVLSFVFAPAGLILSIIALREINRTREQGKAFAIAGIVISAIAVVIMVIAIVIAVIAVIYVANHPESWSGSYCVNGDCHYKDYGDSDFSAAFAGLTALRTVLPF
ncbi:hypothetical protein F7D09_0922 [Bifidobacterium leontopitheci]|uniref:DUF4190 domain-containing protein n=2 Tax=Bifidobacterium leontopitheci TaxID=2650774 RepID=A0A6I1GFY6_9BIFI|nr:hypothetical protein F7D09_0922 [Bifidobacterium leontopitheci]